MVRSIPQVTLVAALGGALLSVCCTPSVQGNQLSSRAEDVEETVPKEPVAADILASCGAGVASDTGARAISRLPYLQKVTTGSAEILWTSTAPEVARVRVTKPDGTLVTEVTPQVDPQSQRPEFQQYVAALDALEPASIYCYEVVGDSGTWFGPTGFRTAQPASDVDAVRFVVMGDLGTRTNDQFAVLDQIENVDYDLALVAGDLAYPQGTLKDEEDNFFSVYEPLLSNIPFYVISGNHDYDSDGAVFREVFSLFENGGPDGVERWYSFDRGPVHFVALDTERTGDVQAAWLEQDLQSTDRPWLVAYMHKPPYSSGYHGSTSSVQQYFVPLFERYGVDVVFSGHDHDYERTVPMNGVTYVVTGSAGRGTRPVGHSKFTVYSEAVSHFTYVSATQDEMRVNAIDASGHDFDAFVLHQ